MSLRGFTLVELLVAVALLGIVVVAVAGIDLAGRRSLISANRRARVQDEARYAMEHMVRNIRLGNEVDPDTGTSDWVQVRMDWDPVTRQPIGTPGDFTDDFWVWYRFRPPDRIQYCYRPPGGGWGVWETIAEEIVNPTEPDPDRPLFTIVATDPARPIFLTIDLTARYDADPSSSAGPNNPEVRLQAGVSLRSKARD